MAETFGNNNTSITSPPLSAEVYPSIDRPQINGLGITVPWGAGTVLQAKTSGGSGVSTAPSSEIDELKNLILSRPAGGGESIVYNVEGIVGPPGIPGPPGPMGLPAPPVLGLSPTPGVPTRVLDDGITPATPTGLTASAGVGYVMLEWNSNIEPDMDHYEIWRNTSNNSGTATKIGDGYQTLLSDGGLTGGTPYYYWIKAVDRLGNTSGFSSVATATPTIGSFTIDVPLTNGITFSSKPTTSGGGIDSYTKLCSHFDGADGATTYTDPVAGAITFYDNSQLDTAQYKFGASSLLVDGTSRVKISGTDFDIVDGQALAIDFCIRASSLPSSGNLVILVCQATWAVDESYYIYIYNDSGTYYLHFQQAGVSKISGSISITTGGWHHIALTKNTSNLFKLFYDGTQVGSSATVTGFSAYHYLNIGGYDSPSSDFSGWIDEVRVSQGTTRWTENFTPPTEAYSVETTTYTTIWTSGVLTYKGSDYTIVAEVTGDANYYIYWDLNSSPTTFHTTNTLSTAIGADKWVMCYGDSTNGAVYPATSNKIIHGGLIQAGTITADQILTGSITSDKILNIAADKILISGSVYLSNWAHGSDVTKIDGGDIYAGSITATQIAAGTITANELAVGAIDASSITTGTLTADIINVTTLNGIIAQTTTPILTTETTKSANVTTSESNVYYYSAWTALYSTGKQLNVGDVVTVYVSSQFTKTFSEACVGAIEIRLLKDSVAVETFTAVDASKGTGSGTSTLQSYSDTYTVPSLGIYTLEYRCRGRIPDGGAGKTFTFTDNPISYTYSRSTPVTLTKP